ncbi:MAG: MATE family efflux transporter, partial [Aeromonas veronii]
MSAVDLGTAPLSRLFWRYVTPTVAAMLITGIYVTIDGIFVGHVLGQDGMAGLMLAYPICAVLYAVGALIGMGASSLVSFYLGQGNPAKARHIVGNALVMVLLASALLSFIGIRYGEPMLAWMGAEGEIFTAGLSYLQAYAWLGVFAVLSMAFSSLLRNDGRPGFVTLIMVAGGLLNVLLDYLLMVVFPFGLAGVATATMLSQAVTGLACLWHFFTPRSQLRISWDTLRPDLRLMGETVRLGVSSFLMYLYLSVVLALHNKALLAVGTSLHVAAYGVISYTEAFFYLVFEGIAMGIQPIASFNAGAGHWRRVLRIRNLALGVTLGIALCAMIPLYLWPEAAVYLFAGDNAALLPVASLGIWLYFWGLPMEGLLLVGATYFQA